MSVVLRFIITNIFLLATYDFAVSQHENWPTCLKQTAYRLGQLHKNESEEILVRATIAECRDDEMRALKLAMDSGLSASLALETIEKIKKSLHNDMIATVLRGRLHEN